REKTEEKKKLYTKTYGAKIEELSLMPFEISSTEICGMIRRGEDYSPYVPKIVHDFIEEKGLYR
ncbi:MAG: nicotinic acid mononucleotide adenylyltransferase, partial [Eubacteriales bacterium]